MLSTSRRSVAAMQAIASAAPSCNAAASARPSTCIAFILVFPSRLKRLAPVPPLLLLSPLVPGCAPSWRGAFERAPAFDRRDRSDIEHSPDDEYSALNRADLGAARERARRGGRHERLGAHGQAPPAPTHENEALVIVRAMRDPDALAVEEPARDGGARVHPERREHE